MQLTDLEKEFWIKVGTHRKVCQQSRDIHRQAAKELSEMLEEEDLTMGWISLRKEVEGDSEGSASEQDEN